jgi:hypothetical protein
MADTKLVVLFAMLHLVAIAAGGGLLLLALHGDDPHHLPRHPRGEGGNRPPDPPLRPTGGPPMPAATPARVRLREPARLADLLPRPSRRAVREPRPTAPKRMTTVRRSTELIRVSSRPSVGEPHRAAGRALVRGWASMPIAAGPWRTEDGGMAVTAYDSQSRGTIGSTAWAGMSARS